jgi:membrane associated rhomboid family serine protease
LLTHPFAHVSAYHLLLDGGAFFLLYHGLRDVRTGRRLLVFLGAATGSLILAVLHPAIATSGLCGLSGAAHGLMAVTGLVMAAQEDPAVRHAGLWATGLVLAKSLFEACTGWVLFSDLHLGDIGRPNPLCHLGGTLGGMAAWWPVRRLRTRVLDPMPDVEGKKLLAPS